MNRTWSGIALAAVVLLGLLPGVLGPSGVAAATDTQPGASPLSSGGDALDAAQLEPDGVVMVIALHEDGNATWRVEYRMRLATENETEAFEDLAADIRANRESYTQEFGKQMRATARSAENRTGRSMRILNVSVSAETRQLPQKYGVVTYRFTWTNFAAVRDSTLSAGDAIAQLFLDEETTLVLEWPDGYRVESVAPEPTDRRTNAVLWKGPIEFTAGQPSLVLLPGAGSTATPSPTPGTTAGGVGGGTGDRGLPLWLLAAGALVAVVGVAGLLSHRGVLPIGGSDSGAAGAPDELLGNEEQLMALLEQEGGRMKQQEVVEELDWSTAKTSRVVGNLRDEGHVETIRIGRENVIRLPED